MPEITSRTNVWAPQPIAVPTKTIDVPSIFISGSSDWGVYQRPGAVEKMNGTARTRMIGVHLLDGAGHWVQQESLKNPPNCCSDFSARLKYDEWLRTLGCVGTEHLIGQKGPLHGAPSCSRCSARWGIHRVRLRSARAKCGECPVGA